MITVEITYFAILQFSQKIILFRRHRHSFIGNNLEKLPRSETNLTRYQTNLALDQVEHKGTVVPDSSSFNIKYAESRGVTELAESVLRKKNRKDENDNNEKLSISKRNTQLKTTVRIFQIDF